MLLGWSDMQVVQDMKEKFPDSVWTTVRRARARPGRAGAATQIYPVCQGPEGGING